jgi:uncharacterized phage protein (TIGR02220 family)
VARMSIDDMLGRDPRLLRLAKACGWSKRETAGCLVLDVWPLCYDREKSELDDVDIDVAADMDGFAQLMVNAGLAARVRPGRVRISGSKERIKYLQSKRDAGYKGGLKSGESRSKQTKQNSSTSEANSKQTSTTGQASGNPSASASVPPSASASVPVPVLISEKNSATPTAGGLLSVQDQGGKRKPKPSEPTQPERVSVTTILSKLSAQNGVRYSGTDEHTRLIVNHLRAGVSEVDLRAVVGYCAIELGWAAKPEMAVYLRPETLFGPKTLAKYLDPARTWLSKLPKEVMS